MAYAACSLRCCSLWLALIISLTQAGLIIDAAVFTPADDFLRPQWSAAALNAQKWSASSVVLRKDNRSHTYMNYTIDRSTASMRFIQRNIEHGGLQKRGHYSSSPLNLWNRNNAHRDKKRKLWIKLCYESASLRKSVKDAMKEAICRWHVALGPRTSIGFIFTDPDICGQIAIFTEPVWIMRATGEGAHAHSTLGATPSGMEGEMDHFIKIDNPERNYPHADGYSLADTLIHELGHTLGLLHEHFRSDLAQYRVTFDCSRVPGYEAVQAYVNEHHPVWPAHATQGRAGQPITLQDVCYRGELSRDDTLPFRELWHGAGWVIDSFDPQTYLNSLGSHHVQRTAGPFDFGSIMLYDTARTNGIIWDARTGQNVEIPHPRPGHPSPGDVAAVKMMYPDLPR